MANLLGLTVKTLFILQLGALCLGNELSLLTGEIDSRFSDLYYSESLLCSQTALQAFISECSVKGADNVSPKLRLQSAVKLSICEFKEANVKYPKSCQDMVSDEEFQICVQEFRESAQLWTTYSGHYRKLRSVCYEEAVPFIRQNILDLFLNVTKIYTDFHSAAMKTSNKANGFQEELLAKFQAIVDLMDQSFVMKERQMEAQEDTFDGFQQSMVQKSKYVEDVWDQVSQDISVNSARVDQDLTAAHEKLQTIFEYIDTQFSRISTANENLAAVHFEASQSISKDLMMLSKNSTNGHLELQETLQGNLDKSLQINHLLHDSQVQIGNIFDSIESESRDIIANITRDLRDEALTIFVVFQTTFDTAFSQLRSLSHKVGQTIFNMDAVSLSLDSNLETLQERISDLKGISIVSILNPLITGAKSSLFLLLGISLFLTITRRQDQGVFFSALFLGATTAYIARSFILQIIS